MPTALPSHLVLKSYDPSSNQAISAKQTLRLLPAAPDDSGMTSLLLAERLERKTNRLSRRIESTTARVRKHQTARLSVAGLFFLGLLIGTLKPEWRLELPLILVFLILFSWLVVRTSRLKSHLRELEGLKRFYERQRLRLLGQPSGRAAAPDIRDDANEEIQRPLSLAKDLGILGPHSLFSLLDETLTDQGERRLLEQLDSRPRPIDEIRQQQEKVQNLRSETWFYTRLTLIADAQEFRVSSGQILSFLREPFVSSAFTKYLALTIVAWLVMVGGFAWAAANGTAKPGLLILVFAGVNFWALGQVGSLFKKGVGLENHLSLLGPIFARLEKRARQSPKLARLLPVTTEAGPSSEARRLGRVLTFLGTETNPLLHLLINAVLPWSMVGNFFLERRRAVLAKSFPTCLKELAELEVLGSVLILDRYQTQTYPTFASEPHLEFHGIYHPLIARSQVVANDFGFPSGKSLGLLTGSNMAGKSTFLRTVGLNQILAQMGAPVFAESYVTYPFRIETCIEVSDSLRDGFSYFYAEVRRLRDLLRTSDTGEPVLYLIDEIFRGTNNRERHIGSRAVIRSLARHSRSLGFISTHDLELVSLESTEPRLLNLHFREDFEAGKMVFHYKLRLGPCPTTNALKIMQAEGIAVDEA